MDDLPKLPYWVSHFGIAFAIVVFIATVTILGYYKSPKTKTVPVIMTLISANTDIDNIGDSSFRNDISDGAAENWAYSKETSKLKGIISGSVVTLKNSGKISSVAVYSKTLGNLRFDIDKIIYKNDSVKFIGVTSLNKTVYNLKIVENAQIENIE